MTQPTEEELTARNHIALRSKKQLLHVTYDGLIALMNGFMDFAPRTQGNRLSTAFATTAVGLASQLVLAAGEAVDGDQEALAGVMAMALAGWSTLVKAATTLITADTSALAEPVEKEKYGKTMLDLLHEEAAALGESKQAKASKQYLDSVAETINKQFDGSIDQVFGAFDPETGEAKVALVKPADKNNPFRPVNIAGKKLPS